MSEIPHTVSVPGYLVQSMIHVMRRLMIVGRRIDTLDDCAKGKVLIELLERQIALQSLPKVSVVARSYVHGFPRHHWTRERREKQFKEETEKKILSEILRLDDRDGGMGSYEIVLYYREA